MAGVSIADSVRRVQDEIADAAVSCGRAPDAVSLMAVTKTRTPEEVAEVIAAGVELLGENRVQEAQGKIPHVSGRPRWELIGHLQTNKARQAARLFECVQSVDSARCAEALEKALSNAESDGADERDVLDILVEVNTSGEESKFGCPPDAAQELIGCVAGMKHLRLRGLMTIGALGGDERRVRRCFSDLRELRDKAESASEGLALPTLSMGMSGDYRWAIAEGSTLVRIGTALFGTRD